MRCKSFVEFFLGHQFLKRMNGNYVYECLHCEACRRLCECN